MTADPSNDTRCPSSAAMEERAIIASAQTPRRGIIESATNHDAKSRANTTASAHATSEDAVNAPATAEAPNIVDKDDVPLSIDAQPKFDVYKDEMMEEDQLAAAESEAPAVAINQDASVLLKLKEDRRAKLVTELYKLLVALRQGVYTLTASLDILLINNCLAGCRVAVSYQGGLAKRRGTFLGLLRDIMRVVSEFTYVPLLEFAAAERSALPIERRVRCKIYRKLFQQRGICWHEFVVVERVKRMRVSRRMLMMNPKYEVTG